MRLLFVLCLLVLPLSACKTASEAGKDSKGGVYTKCPPGHAKEAC